MFHSNNIGLCADATVNQPKCFFVCLIWIFYEIQHKKRFSLSSFNLDRQTVQAIGHINKLKWYQHVVDLGLGTLFPRHNKCKCKRSSKAHFVDFPAQMRPTILQIQTDKPSAFTSLAIRLLSPSASLIEKPKSWQYATSKGIGSFGLHFRMNIMIK